MAYLNQIPSSLLLLSLILLSLPSFTYSFIDSNYHYHSKGKLMEITVGELNSIKTHIPFDYNYLSLCYSNDQRHPKESIGELLSNSRVTYSNYNLNINEDKKCKVYCTKLFTKPDIDVYKWLIDRDYFASFYLDSLPAAINKTNPITNHTQMYYDTGVPIGYIANNTYYVYNHYAIYIDLHDKGDKSQIVGFTIEPFSIKEGCSDNETNTNANTTVNYHYSSKQSMSDDETILYTYDIIFRQSNMTFASRWDNYFKQNKEIHWIGLINANIVVFISTLFVIVILLRAIKRDIDIYNSKASSEDLFDELGWKQVCSDVFRKPKNLMLLCALVGSSVELVLMIGHSLLFAVLGFLRPESRGGLINIMICTFCIMGSVGGFVSSTLYKTNGGKEWLKCTLLTICLFPCLSLCVLFIVRIMLTFEKSSGGINIGELAMLFLLWICLSSPLVLIGSFIGVRKKEIKLPCKINKVPSTIIPKPWYLKLKYTTWITGLIPFATIFIEFVYIMEAMWKHQIFFLASFVSLAVIFLIVSSSEISIIFVYLNLCKGDYNWWWKSFFVSASPCLWIFTYSIYYYFNLPITRFTATIVYFSLMAFITFICGLICGGIGVLITFAFLYLIYSKIKID